MPKILIADAGKASLVMTSEVFKDKLPGALIAVAETGRQCIEEVGKERPDMVVVDFDLPDADGVSVIHHLRRTYRGPILLTAYPDPNVKGLVDEHLFTYNDAGAWVRKPVKFDVLAQRIDQFLTDQHRLGRRFDTDLDTLVIGKGAGRGKRAPKVGGRVVNLSLQGARVEFNEPMPVAVADELTLALELPTQVPAPRATQPKKKAKSTTKAAPADPAETKIKAKVAWLEDDGRVAGMQFGRLSEAQKKGLYSLFHSLTQAA